MRKLLKNHWFWMGMTVLVVAIILFVVAPQNKEEDTKTDIAEKTKESRDSEPAEDYEESDEPDKADKVERVKESEEAEEIVHFKDSDALDFKLPQDSQKLQLGPILIMGKLKDTEVAINDNKIADWIDPVVTENGDGVLLMINEVPENFMEGSFELELAGGDKKLINLKKEDKSWPVQKGKTVNEGFEALVDPFEYKLENAVKVYGLSHITNQLGFGATYEYRFKNRSPACVYSFSDKDPVGEMHAIWDLGGRFLLRDEGVVLGGDNASLDSEIMKDKHKAGDELVLETNDTGRKLLDDYCSALGILPGSLQITLPGDLWAAVYQTLFKVAVVDNEIDVNTVFKKDKDVSWRLKGNEDGYSIIIQKSDLE
jgi:hypothetical protein